MPFRKNIQRENILLRHWRAGHTVKETELLTGIPGGSISHYFARFNKNKEKGKVLINDSQEPPRTDPSKTASSLLQYIEVAQRLLEWVRNDDFAKARDYLEFILLFDEFQKRRLTIIQNSDPTKNREVLQKAALITGLLKQVL